MVPRTFPTFIIDVQYSSPFAFTKQVYETKFSASFEKELNSKHLWLAHNVMVLSLFFTDWDFSHLISGLKRYFICAIIARGSCGGKVSHRQAQGLEIIKSKIRQKCSCWIVCNVTLYRLALFLFSRSKKSNNNLLLAQCAYFSIFVNLAAVLKDNIACGVIYLPRSLTALSALRGLLFLLRFHKLQGQHCAHGCTEKVVGLKMEHGAQCLGIVTAEHAKGMLMATW